LRVRALEAYTRDVGRCIARVDPKSIEENDLADGEFLEIRGSSTTSAKYLPLYPSDWGSAITRIDALIRANCGVSVGDEVRIRRATVTPARRVLLTPLGELTDFTDVFIKQWKRMEEPVEEPVESKFAAEALAGTPVVNGDMVVIDYHLSKTFFLILEKEPSEGISVVSRTTHVELVPWITA